MKNKLKYYRKLNNYTLGKLSKLTGISKGYLCHLEKGTRNNPSYSTMLKLAKTLNVSINKLFIFE